MAKKEIKSNKEKKHFGKDFKAELKKVIWPTPKQLVNNTAVVVALVLITALIVFVLDLGFDLINKKGITKLQTVVQNSVSEKQDTDVEEEATEENTSEETQEEIQESTSEEVQENTSAETESNVETNTENTNETTAE